MGLKRNRAGTSDSPAWSLAPTVPISRLRPVHDLLVVDLHYDRVTVHDDRLSEPLFVFDEGLVEIDDMVETAGSRAAGAVVDLHLETLRGESAGLALVAAYLLEFREDIDAAVRACSGMMSIRNSKLRKR